MHRIGEREAYLKNLHTIESAYDAGMERFISLDRLHPGGTDEHCITHHKTETVSALNTAYRALEDSDKPCNPSSQFHLDFFFSSFSASNRSDWSSWNATTTYPMSTTLAINAAVAPAQVELPVTSSAGKSPDPEDDSYH